MPTRPTDLSEADAQALMSQLLDGELSPENADRLSRFLESNPDAMDWMESSQLATGLEPELSGFDQSAQWSAVNTSIGTHVEPERKSSNLIAFPPLVKALGIAAAVAFVASFAWKNISSDPAVVTERYAASESVVEYVDTEIPDASPVVYTDAESGWTVVWVTEMEPITDETI